MKKLLFLTAPILFVAFCISMTSCSQDLDLPNTEIKSLEDIDHSLTSEAVVLAYVEEIREEVLSGKNLEEAVNEKGNVLEDLNLLSEKLIIEDLGEKNVILPAEFEQDNVPGDLVDDRTFTYIYKEIDSKRCYFSGCGSWYKKITKYKVQKKTTCSSPGIYATFWRCSKDC